MPEQWYWKHRGDTLGPLETDDLELLIKQHRVSDRDEIRLTTSTEWLTGSEVKSLFAGKNLANTSSEAAAALLARSRQLGLGGTGTAAREGLLGAVGTRIRLVIEGVFDSLGSVGVPLKSLFSNSFSGLFEVGGSILRLLANRFVILGIVALALNIVVALQIRNGGDVRNRRVLEELTSLWDRYQILNTGDTSGVMATADRQAFRNETLPKLETTLKTLTRDAQRESMPSGSFTLLPTSDRQRKIAAGRRALIQAIQELIAILKKPADEERESKSLEDFQKHLSLAQEVMDNNYQYSRPRWSHQKPIFLRSDVVASMDPWVLSVIIIDAILILVGLRYWLRRKKN